jgi:hypothetical protein
MGALLHGEGKLAEAEPYYREALEKQRRILGDDHPDTLNTINNLGLLLQDLRKLDQAEPFLREALEKSRLLRGDDHPSTIQTMYNLCGLLIRTGEHAEVTALMEPKEAAARKAFTGGNAHRLATFLNILGNARARQRAFVPAENNLIEACSIIVQARGPKHQDTRDMTNELVKFYSAWHAAEPGKGYDAKAAQWKAKLAELQAATQPSSQPASQPVSQPASQPASPPTSQPASQPAAAAPR